MRNHDWKDISDSILKRKFANAEGTPVTVAMYYRGEQERGIDYATAYRISRSSLLDFFSGHQ